MKKLFFFALAAALISAWGCSDESANHADKPKTCDESLKPATAIRCECVDGAWNCTYPSTDKCANAKCGAGTICNPATGQCVLEQSCSDADKTSETCVCNKVTGVWENCGNPQTCTCDDGSACPEGDKAKCAPAACTCDDGSACPEGDRAKCTPTACICDDGSACPEGDKAKCTPTACKCDDGSACPEGDRAKCTPTACTCDDGSACPEGDKAKCEKPGTCTQDECDDWCGDLQSDHDHCGNCETKCEPEEICDNSVCRPKCTQNACDDWCGDLQSDHDHCGNCSTKCNADQYCDEGHCKSYDTCKQDKCENWCGDMQKDHDHCGSCTKICKPEEFCSNGECSAIETCAQDKCDGWCGDLQSDTKHCGSCDIACKSNQTCHEGKCRATHLDGCNGDVFKCYKLKDKNEWISQEAFNQDPLQYELEDENKPDCISPLNEATCGATSCSEYTVCDDSYVCVKKVSDGGEATYACECPLGTVEIEENSVKRCANPYENAHCGISATNPGQACPSDRTCNGTDCVCNPGLVDCDGTCIDPLTDNAHCGVDAQCQNGNVCNSMQECSGGLCACTDSNLINCKGNCINPTSNEFFCGAGINGLCNSDDENSDNYIGFSCGSASCGLIDGKAECVCSSGNHHYDVSQGKCVNKNDATSCGVNHINCQAKYHPEASCSDGECECPDFLIRIDKEPFKTLYDAKIARGEVEPSHSLCVDKKYDNRFCGDELVTCGAGQMCLDGSCISIEEARCTAVGRTLCGDRCINLRANHMKNCDECETDWCSTEPDAQTAGCHGKKGIGLNNCASCLFNGQGDMAGAKCNERFSVCNNGNCACAYNEKDIRITNSNNENVRACVDINVKKIIQCDYPADTNCNNYGFKCRAGWGDCKDGETATPSGVDSGRIGDDGCETNIHEGQRQDDHTILNCGGCGATCAPENVNKALCAENKCSYDECSEGYFDCDGDKRNGCEVQLGTVENCSACGQACIEGGCQNGSCCWDASVNHQYTTQTLTVDDCCTGTKLYRACDNDAFHKTRYACATEATIGDVLSDGVCEWSEVK